jgi:hypothetical protein
LPNNTNAFLGLTTNQWGWGVSEHSSVAAKSIQYMCK